MDHLPQGLGGPTSNDVWRRVRDEFQTEVASETTDLSAISRGPVGADERRWNLSGNQHEPERARLVRKFERLARLAMAELGFGDPSRAVDAWIDLLHTEVRHPDEWKVPRVFRSSVEVCDAVAVCEAERRSHLKAACCRESNPPPDASDEENALTEMEARTSAEHEALCAELRAAICEYAYPPSSVCKSPPVTGGTTSHVAATGSTSSTVSEWATDLDTPYGRKAAREGWKRHWTTAERACRNNDLTEAAFNTKDRPFLNQWENGTTRLKNPRDSSRIQAIERVLRDNVPPRWHPSAKKNQT